MPPGRSGRKTVPPGPPSAWTQQKTLGTGPWQWCPSGTTLPSPSTMSYRYDIDWLPRNQKPTLHLRSAVIVISWRSGDGPLRFHLS